MENCITNHDPAHANAAPIPTDHQQRLEAGRVCLSAALDYLARGLSVLCLCAPDHVAVGRLHGQLCQSPGKMPMHTWKHLQERLPTVDEVRRSWRLYPLGGVGCALGAVSGMVRIDVDGEDAPAVLEDWSRGVLPPTWRFSTGGGGVGLLYGWPCDLPCTTTALRLPGDHAELRLMGTGSQTVLPPSRHVSGSLYTWDTGHSPDEITLAQAPPWLLARLRADLTAPPPAAQDEGTVPASTEARGLDQQTFALMTNGNASYPSRSEHLFAVLVRLVRHGLDDASIATLILAPTCVAGEKPRQRGAKWLSGEIGRARQKTSKTIARSHQERPRLRHLRGLSARLPRLQRSL